MLYLLDHKLPQNKAFRVLKFPNELENTEVYLARRPTASIRYIPRTSMSCLIREITLQMNHPIVRRTVGGAHQGSFTSYALSDLEKDINLISSNIICVKGNVAR